MTKGDKILILVIIILCLFSIFMITNIFLKVEKTFVLIKVDGKDYEKIEIKSDMDSKEIAVITDFGYNLVEVDSKGARVIDASCKDKLDVKQGNIKNVGEIIVCLPNKLTIEIVGIQNDIEVDKISR